MKPVPFAYHRAVSLENALSLLARYRGDAKIIAGGQSLMPMLMFRLVTPVALIDIGGVPNLIGISFNTDGLRLGSLVRWADIENSALIAARYPMLACGVQHIAHYQIRNRGTVGGSLAHADPSAEFPALLLAHGGSVAVAGPNGIRLVPSDAFFHGLLTTDLKDDEIIIEIFLPPWPQDRRWSFIEFARRRGDFAIVGVALSFDIERGRIANSKVVAFGIHDTPIVLPLVAETLDGRAASEVTADLAGAAATGLETFDPPSDSQGTPKYRRALLGELVRRAVVEAFSREGQIK